MICKYVVAPMVACQMSVSWFAWEVMLFSPRARRCGTLQTLSVGGGLTEGPIGDCCMYCDHDAQAVSGVRHRVLRCCIMARRLPLCLVGVSC
jgi:hypothetical protein